MQKRFILPVFTVIILTILLSACKKYPAATVKELSDVGGKKIGAVTGTSAAAYAGRHGEVREYDSAEAMMGDLTAGVIDCAFADKTLAPSYLKLGRNVKALSEELTRDEYRIAAAVEARDLIRDVNSALDKLRSDGVVKLLEDKYVLGLDVTPPSAPDLSAYDASLRLALPKDGFPPYSAFDADGNASGFDAELAKQICGILGVNLVFVPVEYDALVDAARFGRADFSMGGVVAGGDAEYSSAYTTVEISVLTRK